MSKRLFLPLFLAACAGTPPRGLGGQSGEDPGPGCVETVRLATPDEVFEGIDGPFDAAGVLAFAAGDHAAPGTWDDGSVTDVSVGLHWDGGEIRHVTSTPDGTSDTMCEGRVEIDVRYTFATADGRLGESGASVLGATGLESAVASGRWDEGELQGDFVFPDDERTSELHWTAWVSQDGLPGGQVTLTSRGEGPPGPVNTASDSAGPLLVF